MAKIFINDIAENILQYLEVLTPDNLYKSVYSVIINSGNQDKAIGITRIGVKEEYKIKAQKLIKKVISSMKEKGVPIKINNIVFAMGYPDSYKLVKPYYDTLAETCINSRRFIKDEVKDNTKMYNALVKKIKKKVSVMQDATYTLFVPVINEKKEQDVIEETGMSTTALKKIKDVYKTMSIVNGTVEKEDKLAREMFQLIKEGKKLEDVAKDYNISIVTCRTLLKAYLTLEEFDLVENILRNNSLKQFEFYKAITSTLVEYIVKGIKIDNNTMESFSMLDYYTITKISPLEIYNFIFSLRNANSFLINNLNRVINFFDSNRSLGKIVDRETACYDDLKITKNDDVYYLRDYVEQIFSTFEANGIVPYKKLVDIAFYRAVRGVPILPLSGDAELRISNNKRPM